MDSRNRTVTLLRPNMRLDLGGIAKGYAADAALKILKKRGMPRALVAASGDLAIGDPPPGEDGWKIGVTSIDTHGNESAESLVLRNAGVSTSGDTEQAIEINGVRYSHILDPATGLGLTNRIQVTIVAPNATTSDGLATACCILGEKKTLRLVNSWPGVSALILAKSDGKTRRVVSLGFRLYSATHDD